MAKEFYVRLAGAFGVTSLGALFVGLAPFLGSVPTAAGYVAKTPTFSVNREFKGDRLPLPPNFNLSQNEQSKKARAVTPQAIPVGCDASFSPVAAPQLALIYGRCAT